MARELDILIARRGRLHTIVSDNGTEMTSRAILEWANRTGVDWHHIAPGRPQQNGFVASFNGKLRDESLNEEVFTRPAPSSSAGGSTTTRCDRTRSMLASPQRQRGWAPQLGGCET